MDVYPALTYRDLEAAVAFLERAFGLTMEDPVTDGRGALRAVAACHGEGRVLLQPDLPDELHGSHVGQGWVYVAVADPDAHFQRARAAWCKDLQRVDCFCPVPAPGAAAAASARTKPATCRRSLMPEEGLEPPTRGL